MDENQQFVFFPAFGPFCHINGKFMISTAVEASFLAIDEHSSFIVYSAKVEEDLLTAPGWWHNKSLRKPGIKHVCALDTSEWISNISMRNWRWRDVPERPLSRHEGTSTSFIKVLPKGGDLTALRPVAFWYVQMPFRLSHTERWSWGLGYSDHGLVPTLSVQGVVNGGVLTAYLVILVDNSPPATTSGASKVKSVPVKVYILARISSNINTLLLSIPFQNEKMKIDVRIVRTKKEGRKRT